MQATQLHIIHLSNQVDRIEGLLADLKVQGLTNVRFWEGIIVPERPSLGIARAHKQIVQFAKDAKLESILIGEDDLEFTAPGAYQYFMEQTPLDFDLYLGTISGGKINDDNLVTDFSGLHFYTIHNRFYNEFLATPEMGALDRCLKGRGRYVVCDRLVVMEREGLNQTSGTYPQSLLYAGRQLFGREPMMFR